MSHLDSNVAATMNPSITIGTQEREYTLNDLAVLGALGYNVVPEPSTALLAIGGLSLLFRRRRCA